ncbi:nickel/cobalt efflux system [Azorhizobium oxalatiphilum]|uniref:Nickel/cobalt efflux system n=2 Tax=Azorhizobium oxalatiphilum TaxID=980631 RepID=A0A917CAS3_9HYPH|nr:nickel/cobalt efflux system [Azorhizobium oxalatiphilum]
MPSPRALRLLLLALAGAGVALAVAEPALAQVFGQSAPKTSPFGLGAGGPQPTGITGYLIAKQSEFYRALVQAVRAAKADGNALYLLAGLSFGYGVFHAAGPGHGKAVISSYLLADGGTLKRGALLALAAGMVQAVAAVLFVGILALLLGATAVSMANAMTWVEVAAYGTIAVFGAVLAFRKARTLIAVLRGEPAAHVHGPDCGCGDKHAPDPHLLDGRGGWKRATVAVISAGARPCSGAILVLTFALSQSVWMTGVISVFAMGLGTALTVTAIAALAVYGKRLAVSLASAASGRGTVLVLLVEMGAAILVCLFGLALLTGYAVSERLLPG